jgi:hypothetical protein
MSDKNVWDILNRNLFFIKNAVATREAKTVDKLPSLFPSSRAAFSLTARRGYGFL